MKRRGFLTAILAALGALLAGKLPAKAQEPEVVEEEMENVGQRVPGPRPIIPADGPSVMMPPPSWHNMGTLSDGVSMADVTEWQYWSDGGWKFLDDGGIWLDKLEDIARAEALRIDAEIMGDAPKRSRP